jgi:hypothetical protein
MAYGAHEVKRLIDEQLSTHGTDCRTGVVAREGKIVSDSCAEKISTSTPLPGNAEAQALLKDLNFLADSRILFQAQSKSVIEALYLEAIARIRANGVATYLAAKCEAHEAFALRNRPQAKGVSKEVAL